MNLVYAAIGAIIFSLYIVYDTQIMVGGKHKVKNLLIFSFVLCVKDDLWRFYEIRQT